MWKAWCSGKSTWNFTVVFLSFIKLLKENCFHKNIIDPILHVLWSILFGGGVRGRGREDDLKIKHVRLFIFYTRRMKNRVENMSVIVLFYFLRLFKLIR